MKEPEGQARAKIHHEGTKDTKKSEGSCFRVWRRTARFCPSIALLRDLRGFLVDLLLQVCLSLKAKDGRALPLHRLLRDLRGFVVDLLLQVCLHLRARTVAPLAHRSPFFVIFVPSWWIFFSRFACPSKQGRSRLAHPSPLFVIFVASWWIF
jgi:hypothetical protein